MTEDDFNPYNGDLFSFRRKAFKKGENYGIKGGYTDAMNDVFDIFLETIAHYDNGGEPHSALLNFWHNIYLKEKEWNDEFNEGTHRGR